MPGAPVPGPLSGASVRRQEDPALLTGRARYVDDLTPAGTLALAFLRSPHAHAHLRGLEVRAAAASPGVVRVLTGQEVQGLTRPLYPRKHMSEIRDLAWHALPVDRVRHVGEPVAAVLAEDRYQAEDALEAIAVEYEPLPVVADAEQALAGDAPLLFPEWGSNELYHATYANGALDAAFAQADLVLHERFAHHRCTGVPLEPRGCLVEWDVDARTLTIWSSTQIPQVLRRVVAEALGLDPARVRAVAPEVGGAFGNKQFATREEVVAAVLARDTGRPVKWIEDRRENLIASVHAQEQLHELEVAVRADGTLLGLRARILSDEGNPVLCITGLGPASVAARFLPGPYDWPAYGYELRCLVTNKCPMGAYRGYGHPQATYSRERVLDRIARELDLDPAEVRRRNLVASFPHRAVMGALYDSGDYRKALEVALAAVDYAAFRAEQARARAAGRLIGLGMACFVEGSGPAYGPAGVRWVTDDGVRVRVEPDGRVRVWVTTAPSGQGNETMIAQVVADALSVPLEAVTVIHGDTAAVPDGRGTFGSRGAIVGAGGALVAARTVREQALALAARRLGVAPDDLELTAGRVAVRGAPARGLALGDLARLAAGDADRSGLAEGDADGSGLEARYVLPDPEGWPTNTSAAFSYAVHVATVEVDPETGGVRPLRYAIAHDCGTVVNPALVEGQIVGALAQGLGSVLLERMVYDREGQPLTASLLDYLVPTATDLPTPELYHLETPAPHVPGGFKGVAESGTIGAPAAIANAVEDALAHLGAKVVDSLLAPETVLQLIEAAGH